ncbi:MAG: hypothetical protein WDW38_002604 [Sanguina aurantia]
MSLLSPGPYKVQVRMFRNSRAIMLGTSHLTYLEGDNLRLQMSRLPPNFIGNMCRLANEQMGPAVRMRSAQPSSSATPAPDDLHGIAYGELFYSLVFKVGRCPGDLDSTGTPISGPSTWGEAYLCPALFESAGLTLLASNTRSRFLDGCKTCDTFSMGIEGKQRGMFALNVMRRTLELKLASGTSLLSLAWNPKTAKSLQLMEALRESAEDYSGAAGREAVAVMRLLKRVVASSTAASAC